MASHDTVSAADWPRMLAPVAVLVASVAACSAMHPADAGVPMTCRPGAADAWVGRAASASIVAQARHSSGSRVVKVVMPGAAPLDDDPRIDRLVLFVDRHALITRARCG